MNKKNGYIVDTTYPAFFYKEMQPIWLSTIVNFLGFTSPSINQRFSYLELACGTGLNLLVAAIHYPNSHFVGIDFNEKHINLAKERAHQLGLKNIEFIQTDFETYLQQTTSKFDFIVNHGTFSWISEQHQNHILKIVERCLNKQGLFYLHYMCYPGSTELHPIQKLLNLVDQYTNLNSSESIEVGKQLFKDLHQAGSFVQNAKIEAILKTLESNNEYLAHEFLTDHWKPLYSVDVHEKVFKQTGMNYLGSANPCDNLDGLSIPQKLQPLIQNIKVPALQEYLKDLARDAKQRIDIFQKNPESLQGRAHLDTLNEIYFDILSPERSKKITYFDTPIGRIQAPQTVIEHVLSKFSEKPLSFSELLNMPEFASNTIFLIETIFLLMNAQYIHPVVLSNKDINKEQILLFNKLLNKHHINLQVLDKVPTVIAI